MKWIFNEGLGTRNIAVGVDTEKVHIYSITAGGDPVQLFAQEYDKTNDLNMAPDYRDSTQRAKILKELNAEHDKDVLALNPIELELYSGMQKKDGMLIRGALSKMSLEDFDEQVTKLTDIFNRLGLSYAIDIDKEEARIRFDWMTLQGNAVELYGGPYPLNAVGAGTRYVRP